MASDRKRRCPKCGSGDIRHSARSGLMDSLMGLFQRRPYRCRNCRKRFYAYRPSVPPTEPDTAEDEIPDVHIGEP